jgi:3-methylfumaryl-CoA hydratase
VIETDTAISQQQHLLAALLDYPAPPWADGMLPPLGHWLLFPPQARQSMLGVDGHPERDDKSLPRRMWAGGRLELVSPVPIDAPVTRETNTVREVEKTGRSGRMRFVTLCHRFSVAGSLVVEEEQDIVYLEAPSSAAAAQPGPPLASLPPITRTIEPGPATLFRFSALTFNAHRIHYDRDYARQAEGYPALVVQGPFIATHLMDLFLQSFPDQAPKRFSFRAISPAFDSQKLLLGLTPDASGGELIAADSSRCVVMQARVDVGGVMLRQ